MSKKKFAEGLESLFDDALEDSFQEQNPLLAETTDPKPAAAPAKKRSSSKDFASELNSLFEETLQETVQEKAKQIKRNASQATKRRTRKPLSGLDMLIRRTVETSELEVGDTPPRRVTLVFDPDKLEKLKTIARLEKSYLKDIVSELVAEYIETYEKQRGRL